MSKLLKKIQIEENGILEDYVFDSTTGVKGYDYYSTDEMVVGKWIDGKPIYRKYFKVNITLQANTWNSSIANDFNGEQPVKVAAINNDAKHSYEGFDCQFYTDNKVYLKLPQPCNITNLFIWYTKTTDQPDSFKEETIELTAEHKTGETFNGKPVYEKIEESTNIQLGKWYSPTGIKTPNVEKVIEVSGYWDSGANGSVEPLAARVDASTYGSSVEYHQGTHGMSGEFAVYLGTSLSSVKTLRLKAKYTKTTD